MKSPISPLTLDEVRTCSLRDRASKVSVKDFAQTWQPGGTLVDFLDRLPDILAANDIRAVIKAIAEAARSGNNVMMAMGAHVIKVGLNPLIIDLMERKVLSGLAINGAGTIHDLEIALVGRTSEDVAAGLGTGDFGMAKETCEFLSEAIRKAGDENIGLGQSVGLKILEEKPEFISHSILAAGARLGVPVTVHVAIGTDILHMHPGFDPAAAGAASHRDFRIFAAQVADLQEGVYMNVGSAVILPEVFLKAVTLVRNLGHRLDRLTTVNLDFIHHYRPITNVVARPTAEGGRGFAIVGHHELLLPLIAAGVIEMIEG